MRCFTLVLALFAILMLSNAALAQRDPDDQPPVSSEGDGSFLKDMFSSGTKTKVTSGQGSPNINEVTMEDYNGPKARIAVARFTDKTGRRWWTRSLGDGMADQLATALFNSNRYIVLERQLLNEVLREQDLGASGRVRTDTAAPIGQIEGAELLVTGSVTEFEGNTEGAQGGLGSIIGGSLGHIVGAISGGYRKAHMAIDVRVIDTRTSRIVAAVSVEGEATDVNLGGALGGAISGGALHGSLGGWKNTPIEKALRICIQKAVQFIVSKTPAVYYRHGAAQAVAAVQQPTAPAPTAAAPTAAATVPSQPPSPVYAKGAVVRVKSERLNMRAGPSTANAVVTGLQGGAPLLVEEQAGDWIRVKTEGGDIGWVAAWLTFQDTKLSPEHFAPAPAPVVPAVQPQPASPSPAPVVPAAQPQPAGPTPTASATAAGVSSPPSKEELFSRLKQLKDLFNAELITEEEYTAKKKDILDKL